MIGRRPFILTIQPTAYLLKTPATIMLLSELADHRSLPALLTDTQLNDIQEGKNGQPQLRSERSAFHHN